MLGHEIFYLSSVYFEELRNHLVPIKMCERTHGHINRLQRIKNSVCSQYISSEVATHSPYMYKSTLSQVLFIGIELTYVDGGEDAFRIS